MNGLIHRTFIFLVYFTRYLTNVLPPNLVAFASLSVGHLVIPGRLKYVKSLKGY